MECHSSMFDDDGNRTIDVWMVQGKNYAKQHLVLYEIYLNFKRSQGSFLVIPPRSYIFDL